MSLWQNVTYYQNGTMAVSPPDRNQPVQGNGRYTVPRRWGGMAHRVDLQSDAGSTAKIFDINWYEPWRSHL